jgi:hypothetical protein
MVEEKQVDLQTLTGGSCTQFLWGEKKTWPNPPITANSDIWLNAKTTDSSVRLENAFRIESRMGKTHDKFSPMELRVSKLIWWSHIFPIGIINIQYHENVIKYHVVSRSDMSGGPNILFFVLLYSHKNPEIGLFIGKPSLDSSASSSIASSWTGSSLDLLMEPPAQKKCHIDPQSYLVILVAPRIASRLYLWL